MQRYNAEREPASVQLLVGVAGHQASPGKCTSDGQVLHQVLQLARHKGCSPGCHLEQFSVEPAAWCLCGSRHMQG